MELGENFRELLLGVSGRVGRLILRGLTVVGNGVDEDS
jgi:hypothetical protein